MNKNGWLIVSKIVGIIVSIFFVYSALSPIFGLAFASEGADLLWYLEFYAFNPIVLFITFFNLVNFLKLKKYNSLKIKKYLKYSSFIFIFLSLLFSALSLYYKNRFLPQTALILFIPAIIYYLMSFLVGKIKLTAEGEMDNEKQKINKVVKIFSFLSMFTTVILSIIPLALLFFAVIGITEAGSLKGVAASIVFYLPILFCFFIIYLFFSYPYQIFTTNSKKSFLASKRLIFAGFVILPFSLLFKPLLIASLIYLATGFITYKELKDEFKESKKINHQR